MSIFSLVSDLERSSVNAAVCTVVLIKGSTPRKAGAKMIVIDNAQPYGQVVGTIGGGAIEHLIRKKALLTLTDRRPLLISVSLRNELDMCCGGEMTVYIEPIVKKPKFICFGAGHISQALCPLVAKLDYEIFVADHRKELLTHEAFRMAHTLFADTSIFSLRSMPFSADTYAVIATHDHDLDQKIVEGILLLPFKYAALVGSQRKALMVKKRLLAKGFLAHDINRIFCPAGLAIEAQSPEEIAVAIAAQMTQVKNDTTSDRRVDRSSREESAHGL